jgi:predicted nucleotidyltransferase
MKYIADIIKEGNDFLKSELRIIPEHALIVGYVNTQWKEFITVNNFDFQSSGIYIPQSHRAYLNVEKNDFVCNIYHEYFGHGLFCEHSLLGRELVEKSRLGKGEDYLNHTLSDSLKEFGILERNIMNYEGFALWMEEFLCTNLGKMPIWKKRYENMSSEKRQLLEKFLTAEKDYTRFGFMSQLGFPKYYAAEDILSLMQNYYGQEFGKIEFILLYGSRKPYSDIDLFVISHRQSSEFFNGWLDIYDVNKKDFLRMSGFLDISVTDPLFTGELIYGNKEKLFELQKDILKKPITKSSIQYNLLKADLEKTRGTKIRLTSRQKSLALSYTKTYMYNALALRKGLKLLTKNNIESAYKTSNI